MELIQNRMSSQCILCNNQSYYRYSSVLESEVVICKKCTLTKLDPLPSAEELESFYQKEYREKYSKVSEIDQEAIKNEKLRAERVIAATEYLFPNNEMKVLDTGCSAGQLLTAIQNKKKDTVCDGIEFNSLYADFAEKHISGKLYRTPLEVSHKSKNSVYDFVFLVHVLEHIGEPLKMLRQVQKLLKSGGTFYVEVPNLNTPYRNLKKEYFQIYHNYYFSEQTLESLLIKSGFEIIKKQTQARTSIAFLCKKVKEEVAFKKEFSLFMLLLKLNIYKLKYNFISLLKIFKIHIIYKFFFKPSL